MQVKFQYCKKEKFDFRCARFVSRVGDVIIFVNDLNQQKKSIKYQKKKKRKYASRIIEVENGTFTPLVFTTTGGMSQECQRYHSRLAELISSKKQETDCATTITWIRTKVSFAILLTALVCLRGTRSRRRKTNLLENREGTCWTDMIIS